MRFLTLPLICGGLVASSITANAQDILDVKSDDPLVVAAYAKSASPSGVAYSIKHGCK